MVSAAFQREGTVNQREGQIITEYLAVLVESRIKCETTHTSPDILTEKGLTPWTKAISPMALSYLMFRWPCWQEMTMNWAHRLCQETATESICSVNTLRQKSLVNQSKSSTPMRIGKDLRAKMLLGKKKKKHRPHHFPTACCFRKTQPWHFADIGFHSFSRPYQLVL